MPRRPWGRNSSSSPGHAISHSGYSGSDNSMAKTTATTQTDHRRSVHTAGKPTHNGNYFPGRTGYAS